jgi:hypothetical protein
MLDGSVKDDVGDDVAVGASHALGSGCASQTSAHISAGHGTSRRNVGVTGDGLTVVVGDEVGLTDGDGDGDTSPPTVMVSAGLSLAAY